MNIPSYIVTFPATTAGKTFFGTPTQPVQIYELGIYVLEQKKKNHLKITMFYSREKIELLAWEYQVF